MEEGKSVCVWGRGERLLTSRLIINVTVFFTFVLLHGVNFVEKIATFYLRLFKGKCFMYLFKKGYPTPSI